VTAFVFTGILPRKGYASFTFTARPSRAHQKTLLSSLGQLGSRRSTNHVAAGLLLKRLGPRSGLNAPARDGGERFLPLYLPADPLRAMACAWNGASDPAVEAIDHLLAMSTATRHRSRTWSFPQARMSRAAHCWAQMRGFKPPSGGAMCFGRPEFRWMEGTGGAGKPRLPIGVITSGNRR